MAPPNTTTPKRRYHLRPAGVFYVGVTIILGVGAINSQNNLLFVIFGVSLGALAFSGFISGAMLMGLRIERAPLSVVPEGERTNITYTVRNTNRIVPAFAVLIEESPASRSTPAHRRWARAISPPRAFIAHLPARAQTHARAAPNALRRGTPRLEGVVASSTFPFGIFKKSLTIPQPDTLVVLPRIRPLGAEIFRVIDAHTRRGADSISRRGRGDEFYGLRDYARGDSPRLIAWKASARSGGLVTRLSAEQASAFLRVLLVLDPHAPRDDPDNPNETAITLAASIAHEAIRRSMHVGIAVPQRGIEVAPGATSRHRAAILEALASIDLADLSPLRADAAAGLFGAVGPNLAIAATDAAPRGLAPDVPVLHADDLARWTSPGATAAPTGDAERGAA